MARTRDGAFPAEDLIQFPRFDAASAVALGERLLQEAAEAEAPRGLPPTIQRARASLSEAYATLIEVERAYRAARGGESEAMADADVVIDRSWSALFNWLLGFSQLPEGVAEADEARALLRELYPDGLDFILLPYELEWGQSDQRLARITSAEETLGERIRKLGGGAFITALSAAHAQYGEVLGLSPSSQQGNELPNLREALEGFSSALRVYALKVTAFVEIDEPETAALSKKLLAPLLTWRVGREEE
jgi:hypothetical protein